MMQERQTAFDAASRAFVSTLHRTPALSLHLTPNPELVQA